MAKQKCEICERDIKTTFLDKIDGTVLKVKDGELNKIVYVCSDCQKEHKDKLKEKISK